jgi:putative transposase
MRQQVEIPEQARIPDEIWERIQVWLPPPKKPGPKGGRPPNDDRKMMDAIYYVLRTGIQWKLLPRTIAAGSSAHDRFQKWREEGVMDRVWMAGLFEYDARKGIDWEWQSIDGAITKAPLGGGATGRNPTDRGKGGSKRSVLVDGRGVPLGISVAGANRPDMELVKATLESIPIERPEVTHAHKQHLLADKGYDYQSVIEIAEAREYIEHICRRGEKANNEPKVPGYRSRRWVVERTHSWMNRFRRILIRWEKKVENYFAFLKLAGAYIAFRAAGILT